MSAPGWRPCWAVVSEYGVEAVFTDPDTAGRYRDYLKATFAAYRVADVAIQPRYLDPEFT